MATDAALLAHARRTGETTLRIYAWERPTLSLGRHERARGRFDAAALRAQGVDAVRRPTGGRALLHHREVTYSVTAPLGVGPVGAGSRETASTAPSFGAGSLGTSYRAINTLLLRALAALGVDATEAAATGRALRPDGAACFAEPGAGELVVRGAKLVGSAQLREDGALLQHGSILIADDQPLIETLRSDGERGAPSLAAATLEDVLSRPVSYDEVRDALLGALVGALADGALPHGGTRRTTALPLDPASLQDDLARLVIAFSDPQWTWRR
jgi:lipoate-protein ligase A